MPSAPPPPAVSDAPDPDSPLSERAQRRDGLWNAPAAVVLGLFFGLMGTIIVAVAGSALGSSADHPSPAVDLVSDGVFDAGFVHRDISAGNMLLAKEPPLDPEMNRSGFVIDFEFLQKAGVSHKGDIQISVSSASLERCADADCVA